MSRTMISDQLLFYAVLRLIFSCTKLVAHEIGTDDQSLSEYSRADRNKLRATAQGLRVLGLLAWIIGHTHADGDARV